MSKFCPQGLKNCISKMFTGKWALVTNTVSGAGLFVVGDIIEQKIEIARKLHPHLDWKRVGRMGAIGLFEGPPHHYFYKYMDKYLPGRSASTITKKIVLDQLIACPFFSFQFFVGMALLEGKNLSECWHEFIEKFPTVYLVDCILWPPCQFINFYLVPTQYRVLYTNVCTVAWNVFLSYMKHYDQFPDHDTRSSLGHIFPVDQQPTPDQVQMKEERERKIKATKYRDRGMMGCD